MPVPLPSLPRVRVAARQGRQARGAGWRCQTGRGRDQGGGEGACWGGTRAPRASRPAVPPPGPTRLTPPPPPRPPARSVLAPRSTPRPRSPARANPAAAARTRRPASPAHGSLHARASLPDARSFPLACPGLGCGGGGRTARGSSLAAAASWPAGHGGGWGRRADETATHPGNEQGEGAAGGGAPRREWGGAEPGRQRRGRGGLRGPATLSRARSPSAAPQPARLAIPFVWPPRARVRGGGGAQEARVGAAGSAPRASSPPASSAWLRRDPGTPAGPSVRP